jgi:hypothetical protein
MTPTNLDRYFADIAERSARNHRRCIARRERMEREHDARMIGAAILGALLGLVPLALTMARIVAAN